MSLGDFMADSGFGGGSWADEVEETSVIGTQALPPSDRPRMGGGYSSYQDRGYSVRETVPQRFPDKPPYTAHLGNLSYDATNETVTEFFEGCEVASVRIIEDREMMRPKGFGYVEFATADGLRKALELDGQSFQNRMIKIKIADPPRGGEGVRQDGRDMDWTRKGPLADAPGPMRGGRQPSEFGERRPRDPEAESRPPRDLNWGERRGPLAPLPQEPDSGFRGNSRPRPAPEGMGERSESYRGGRAAATWGEGRSQEDGGRPRREFTERPERPERPERTATAAEQDMKWRERMRPDASAETPSPSGEPSAPASPALSNAAPASGGRPKLNLAKRTVSEAIDPSPSASDSKASPFGAARPIDTRTREKEVEEKRQQALREKKEAEEKAKEERRLAKEAAAAKAAEGEAEADAEKTAEAPAGEESKEDEQTKDADASPAAQNGESREQKLPTRTREPREAPKSRATEAGNWRSASFEGGRGGRGGAGPRGGRGGGPGRGGRDGPRGEGRGPRSNGPPSQPATPITETEPATPTVDEDGWTTVTVPKKGRTVRS